MNAIIIEIEEKIALLKKQEQEHQEQANKFTHMAADSIKLMYQSSNMREQLEKELHQVKKDRDGMEYVGKVPLPQFDKGGYIPPRPPKKVYDCNEDVIHGIFRDNGCRNFGLSDMNCQTSNKVAY